MIIRKGPAIWALLFALHFEPAGFAARQQTGNRNSSNSSNNSNSSRKRNRESARSPQSKDEADAFNALQREQAPDKKVEMAEAFVAKYPNSDFVQYAQTFRLTAL